MSSFEDADESEKAPLLSINKEGETIKPPSIFIRYLALTLMCLVGFGAYFAFDSPSSLVDDIKKDLKISTTTYAALYSWFNLPSIIMCFVGGFFIDLIFGVRLGSIAFLILLLLGQLMFAAGAYKNSIFVMDLGRFILGLVSSQYNRKKLF